MSWRVELTAEAAARFRGLSREAQEAIGAGIERLRSEGIPSAAKALPGSNRWVISIASHALTCTARPDERLVTIVAIEPVKVPRHIAALRALPVRLPGPGRKLGFDAARADWLGDLRQDLTYALRTFRRKPGFVIVTVLILALGIGANTAVFSVVNNVFLRPLPFHEGDQVVRIRNYTIGPAGEQRRYNVSPRYFYAIRETSQAFDEVAAGLIRNYSLTGDTDPERVRAILVSQNWAPMLGVDPVLGRYFSDEEQEQGSDSRVTLLSHALWQRSLGGRRDVVGSDIVLDGRAHTVIGVMPARFRFPYDADLWLPGHFDRSDARSHSYNVLARLKPDIDIAQAQLEVDRIAAGLEEELPTHQGVGLSVASARENFVDDEDRIVLALLAAVGFLLLIAGANVANLLIARFTTRQREITIRAALGAGRGRQLRQFLTETLLLFLMGGIGGLLLTLWARGYLVVLIPSVLSDQLALGEIELDVSVLVFAAVVSIVTGLVFGALAAWRAARPDLQTALKLGGRGVTSGKRRLQRVLIVSEMALALTLLMGASLMIKNFRQLQSRDLGFSTENLLTLRLNLGGERFSTGEAKASTMTALLEAVGSVPGVSSVGTTSDNPICCGDWGAAIVVEGLEPRPDAPSIVVFHRYVTPGFFETMGIPLVRGRLFTDEDDESAVPSVIVDERMAEHFWPGEDPLGKRVRNRRSEGNSWRTVVGVVGAVHDMGDYQDTWYVPFFSEPTGRATEHVHLMAQLEGEPGTVIPGIRRAVREVDPNLPIFELEMMDELYGQSLSQDQLGAVIAALFGVFGLLLAAFGIYGVMSFIVSQRDHEIGVRIALGAQRNDVIQMVLRQSLRFVLVGAAVGLAGAVVLNRVLASLIVDLSSLDPLLLSGVTALLVVIATAATLLPARRASRVDPVQTFRV